MKYLHTMVRVSNLDGSIGFYCTHLGLREIARFDNEAGRFLPGMFCHVRLVLERSAAALVLPGSAVRADAEGPFVFVVEEGVVRARRVELGIDDGLRVEVLEGLAGGEQVVNGNVGGLRDGERVRAVEGAGQ